MGVLACVQAYQTRNVNIAFNESHFIALCLISMLQAALIGIPLIFLSNENPIATYFVRSCLVFIVSIALLGFIFVPKFLMDPEVARQTYRSTTSIPHGSSSMRISGLHNPVSGNFRQSESFMYPPGFTPNNSGIVGVSGITPISGTTPVTATTGISTYSSVSIQEENIKEKS